MVRARRLILSWAIAGVLACVAPLVGEPHSAPLIGSERAHAATVAAASVASLRARHAYDSPTTTTTMVGDARTDVPRGDHESAGWSRSSTSSFALRDAAKAAHDVPIGPVAEKAHRIADRVAAKSAPFQGYKGGRNFENNGKGMLLPKSNADGPIKYREWDVNPYTKGVNRGPERLVTGSDGSAYYTTNHYDTFTRFR